MERLKTNLKELNNFIFKMRNDILDFMKENEISYWLLKGNNDDGIPMVIHDDIHNGCRLEILGLHLIIEHNQRLKDAEKIELLIGIDFEGEIDLVRMISMFVTRGNNEEGRKCYVDSLISSSHIVSYEAVIELTSSLPYRERVKSVKKIDMTHAVG